MNKTLTKLAFLGLCLGLLAAHSAGTAQGEIAEKAQTQTRGTASDRAASAEPQNQPAQRLAQQSADRSVQRSEEWEDGYQILSDRLQIQCWQEGTKIIDERGLRAVDLRSLTQDRQPVLRGKKKFSGEIMIVPLPDATCLVSPEN
jgi:hypothetical protein